jgi:hypothetical protein
VLDGLRRAPQHAERLVADLVAMAVRAVQQVPSPSLPDAGKVRQLVAQSGGHQDPAGTQRRGPGDSYLEAGLDADHGVVDQAAARAALRPAAPPPTTTTS